MKPYYEDDAVTIYHGDCRELIDGLEFDVIVTDPPYGINATTMNATRGRGGRIGTSRTVTTANDYPPIHGDDAPFNPSHLLRQNKPTVLFGANHYSDKLPASATWLVWDKLDGLSSDRAIGFNDQADCELVWTNLGGPARLLAQRWMGAMKSGVDRQTSRRHPTEKPIELMRRIVGMCPDGIVLDPYMGSGPTVRAAKDLGRRAIGIEFEEAYCEIAANRCAQEVLPL